MTDEPDPEWMAEYADYMRQAEQEERELREAEEVAQWHFDYGRKQKERQ